MVKHVENLIGMKFGKLTVVDYAGKDKNNKTNWVCRCSCGRTKIIRATSLKSGATLTCGKCEIHNGSKTALYRYYANLVKKNCCSSWLDFTIYRRWALKNGYFIKNEKEIKYKPSRINNNKPYSPSNTLLINGRNDV